MNPTFYFLNRASISLLILLLLSVLSSHAQNGGVTTTSQSFTYTRQIETFTVPAGVTSLTIEARGAEGKGAVIGTVAGKGAVIRGTVIVSPGQQLSILVGERSTGFGFSSGGGGSFVVTGRNPIRPLVIAGGGGGAGGVDNNNGGTTFDSPSKDGQTGNDAGAAAGPSIYAGAGGTGGSGGRVGGGTYRAGGGGGLLTNGQAGNNSGTAGQAFVNGSTGGVFGGGGGGYNLNFGNYTACVAGGGGGYTGGGGSSHSEGQGAGAGGGGGSFNAGTEQYGVTGETLGNSGNGLVSITYAITQPIRYVKVGGTGDGTSWDNASGDLQSQIDIAGAQQVWVAGGRYTTTANNGSFSLKNGVSVYGGFVGQEQNLTDRPGVNPVNGQPSSTTLTAMSVSVVRNRGLTNMALLDGVVITGGSNNFGGGVFNVESSPVLTNCFITGNSASVRGGGLYIEDSSNPSLINCLISGNACRQGGGIYNFRNSPILTNCTISGNTASDQGGGIYNFSSSPSLTNCTISSNTASNQGGGIYNQGSSPVLTNCLLASNTATNQGGAFHNFNSRNLRLVNCTLTGNSAGDQGGAISEDASTSQLTNAILWNNGGGKAFRFFNNGSTSLTYSLIEQGATGYTSGPGNLTATVSPFVSGTNFMLNACSVAINAGDPTSTTATSGATDLLGNPRFYQNGRIDMGAYEFQGAPSSPVAITQQPVSGSSVCVGSTVTAMVSVSGTSPTYQWYRNGVPLTGNASAISPTLTLSNVQTGDAGSYSVVVSGSCPGSVTSTAFSLTVTTPPTPTLLTQSGQSYPGGQSTVSVDVNSATVNLLVSGCNGGTINWTGPNNTSGSGSTISVPTSAPGTLVYTATCTTNGCTSPPASATVSVGVRLRVLHRDVDNYADNNSVQPVLILANGGGGALPLSAITLRYYLTVENFMPLTNLFINYAQVGAANVKSRYVPLDQPRQGAFGYVEYSFTAGAGQVAANADSGPIQGYIAKSDYGGLNELDDYSYATVRDRLLENPRITAYYNGMLVWGQEPALVTPRRQLRVLTESKNGPSATAITTNLLLRNEGNLPINYQDLRIRYYFTADNQQQLAFYSDYRYEGALRGQLVKINPPLANADTYLEITPTFTGQLMPLSNPGVIRYSVYSPQGARFNQTNDYSYQDRPEDFSPNNRIVVYVGSERVWGQEPGASARIASVEPASELQVRLLGNPLVGAVLEAEVTGAGGQPLTLQLTSLGGQLVAQQRIGAAGEVERIRLAVGQSATGLLLLQVSTPTQRQVLKVLKIE